MTMESFNVKHTDNFNTPWFFFEQLNDIFNFTVDVACDSTNKKCFRAFCYDSGYDGLEESWRDERVFCNPPFSEKKKWIEKAIYEVEKNQCPVVCMILPLNCMSTIFFYDLVIKGGYLYEITKARVDFLDNGTKEKASGNNSGTVIVYFKKDIKTKFSKEVKL